MKTKRKKYISSGYQGGLIENENPVLEGVIRDVEVDKGGKTLLLHRKDGVVEIWVENKFCKRCNDYHNNLPYCPALQSSNK